MLRPDAGRALAAAIQQLIRVHSKATIRTISAQRRLSQELDSLRSRGQRRHLASGPIKHQDAGDIVAQVPASMFRRKPKGSGKTIVVHAAKVDRAVKPPGPTPSARTTQKPKPSSRRVILAKGLQQHVRLRRDPTLVAKRRKEWAEEKARREADPHQASWFTDGSLGNRDEEQRRELQADQMIELMRKVPRHAPPPPPPKTAPDENEAGGSMNETGRHVEGVKETFPAETPEEAVPELEEILRQNPRHVGEVVPSKSKVVATGGFSAKVVKLTVEQPNRAMKIARLRPDLVGIPFSPGVHMMQDPRTGIFNFDPEGLYRIPQPAEFAFDRIAPYSKPSTHKELGELAQRSGCEFAGSTSTLTKAMSQIYFLLSRNKPLDLSFLSGAFTSERNDFSFGSALPALLELTKGDNGVWYIDSDKAWDSDNILSQFGHIMEKMLTSTKDEFAKVLKINPPESETLEQDLRHEAFHYQRGHKLMMRSQLDCYDPRLPGTGVFDIKTRACWPIRHDRANYMANSVYEIWKEQGWAQSYEREYYDMLRATMLKYNFQARIGNMDGIFLAYHNTARIFGFQYLPRSELDERLFGSVELGENAFRLCVALLETIMEQIVNSFPNERNLNVVFKYLDTGGAASDPKLAIFAHRKGDEKGEVKAFYLTVDNMLDGEEVDGHMTFSVDEETRKEQDWSIQWQLAASPAETAQEKDRIHKALQRVLADQLAMFSLSCPEGKTPEAMREDEQSRLGPDVPRTRWKAPDSRALMMRREARESAEAHNERMRSWRPEPERRALSWEVASDKKG